jgi:hypothetical protein
MFGWFRIQIQLLAEKLKKIIYQDATPASAQSYGLDSRYSYFLLHASFGDKWMILSFLPELLSLQRKVKVIASQSDAELLRIFIGPEELSRAIVFLEDNIISEIHLAICLNPQCSHALNLDIHQLTQTRTVINDGFPINTIRHLHIVNYPYFSDLHLVHGVPYAELLKMLMYLPPSASSHQPRFYTSDDIKLAEGLVKAEFPNELDKILLINIVNISHKSLSDEQVSRIVDSFISYGFKILLNITGLDDFEKINPRSKINSSVRCISIPGHLLGLVSDFVDGVFGVVGGAMCVATYFSKAHTFSIYTRAVGFDMKVDEIFGGKFIENIWGVDREAWPFEFENRIVNYIDMYDMVTLNNKMIDKYVADIVEKLSAGPSVEKGNRSRNS